MKGLKTIVKMLGAIPVPDTKEATANFLKAVELNIKRNDAITIYPEAHIWPYYTGIRPFKEVSFTYPIKLNVPVFSMTNTYQKNGNKIKMVTYIDGPFYAEKGLNIKDKKKNLRDKVYNNMIERSRNSNVQYIEYRKKVI